eukprot:gene31960-18244_t
MADRVAADLAADTAAYAGLMNELRLQQHVAATQLPQSNYHAGSGFSSSIQPTHITKDSAPINVLGPSGLSPLAVACMQGNVEDVDLLLKCGADPAA